MFAKLLQHDEPSKFEPKVIERGGYRGRGFRGGYRGNVDSHEEKKDEEDDGF